MFQNFLPLFKLKKQNQLLRFCFVLRYYKLKQLWQSMQLLKLSQFQQHNQLEQMQDLFGLGWLQWFLLWMGILKWLMGFLK